jgi:hypothetical protein
MFKPRPEYPRPDRRRAFIDEQDWLNLNGPWQFRFDGGRRGEAEQWFSPEQPEWREQIIVPFCWESLAAWGEGDTAGNENYFSTRPYKNPLEVDRWNYRRAERYEVGWYRRAFVVPDTPAWQGKRVILTVGAADFFTDCWCNGRHLGRNEGGYTPFEFDLTDALETLPDGRRRAQLVLRVEDPMDNHEQPVGKQWRWYTTVSGIWQTVYVEPRAAVYIERFEVLPNLDHEAIGLRVYTHGGGDEIQVEITAPKGQIIQKTIHVNETIALAIIRIDPLVLWQPDDPQLYRIRLTLRASAAEDADVVHGYFGMRSLWTNSISDDEDTPAMLVFNGEPIYLRGALYQSYHPSGVYTAPDVKVLKDDILYAKRVGFDFLRIHIKIDDPLLLYYADTLGMLLMTDIPNFGEGGDTPLGRKRFEGLMRRAMQRDFNHPSIIAWCLFNETWGFGGQTELIKHFEPERYAEVAEMAEQNVQTSPAMPESMPPKSTVSSHEWIQQMWELAKTLDPTRLVEDMSVVPWDHLELYGHGDTDINSWHFYIHDYYEARDHINKIVEDTYAGSSRNYLPGFQQRNQPLINSEYGGIGALDGDRDISWSFKFLTNELRRHGKLSAYIFTQHHDVEWEYNGFVNYDRTPKQFGYDPMIVNNSDVLALDAPPIQRCAPGQTVAIDVYSSHFSRPQIDNVHLYWRLGGIDNLGRVHAGIVSGQAQIAFPHYRAELAQRLQFELPAQTMSCTLWVWAMTPTGETITANYVQFLVDGGWPAEEVQGPSRIFRVDPSEWMTERWSGPVGERAYAREKRFAYGNGNGFFEYVLPAITPDVLRDALRLRVLCEASSHREGAPQTDVSARPSYFQILLNGVRVFQTFLPNHPHDSRGALSYLGGGVGAYGYIAHAAIEGELLRKVLAAQAPGQPLVLRFAVPNEAQHQGGLTVYGSDIGRYPVGPTVVIEYPQ